MMLEPAHAAEELPIACNLSGAELAERGGEVSNLFVEAEETMELEDGYAFRFPGSDDYAARLLEFTLAERRCCPFFTFELVFEPNQRLWLRLRGSTAIKEFVASGWAETIAAHTS
jgi:hypothetical protein